MATTRHSYKPGAPIPFRPDQPGNNTPANQRRFGFHPAQYRKAQANHVFIQYQRQVQKDKEETLKKRSERNLDGKLKINNLELVFLTINARRWFGISQIVSVLFSHRPRSSVVTRMKMLGIEFYCGNYDELRRMKELGGVETHCSRCKLISEQDLVKLLLCFYRFTALPRGKGKISTSGLSTYLDDILREIAMGRVELGKDFQEDDTGKIDEDTWSQISERMLLKNAEKVEHEMPKLALCAVQPESKADQFAFEGPTEDFVVPKPVAPIPKAEKENIAADTKVSQRKSAPEKKKEKMEKIERVEERERYNSAPEYISDHTLRDLMEQQPDLRAYEEKQEQKQESMSMLLPKLIRAERTKKPPRAIWPRWYPPAGESEDTPPVSCTNSRMASPPGSPESAVSLPAIQCIFNRMQTNGTDPKATASEQELAKYILEGQKSIMEPGPDTTSSKEVVTIKEEPVELSLSNLTFSGLMFGSEDDMIQIITRKDLEQQYNKIRAQKLRQNSDECYSDCSITIKPKDLPLDLDDLTKEPGAPIIKEEQIDYTPEQMDYVQKLKESFDFPYAFPSRNVKKENEDGDEPPKIQIMKRKKQFILEKNGLRRSIVVPKRHMIVKGRNFSGPDGLSGEDDEGMEVELPSTPSNRKPIDPYMFDRLNKNKPTGDDPFRFQQEGGKAAPKTSILKQKGTIIKPKLIKAKPDNDRDDPLSKLGSDKQAHLRNLWTDLSREERYHILQEHRKANVLVPEPRYLGDKSRDRVRSEPTTPCNTTPRPRVSSDSALGNLVIDEDSDDGRASPFLLSDDSGTMSDGEMTEAEADSDPRHRPRKRFRKYSLHRNGLGSGGSSGDEEEQKPDHVYRFKFKSVTETQDYPYMSARPTSLLNLVKLDKCDYPVGCRSAPFLFDTAPFTKKKQTMDRGPFVRQYDIEPSDSVWSGVSLWAHEDSDTNSTTSNSGVHSAPELQIKNCHLLSRMAPDMSFLRRIVSAGNSPIHKNAAPKCALKSPTRACDSPFMSGLDILSSVAFNAEKLRNTPTKQHRGGKKVSSREIPKNPFALDAGFYRELAKSGVIEKARMGGKGLGQKVSPIKLLKIGKKRKATPKPAEWIIMDSEGDEKIAPEKRDL